MGDDIRASSVCFDFQIFEPKAQANSYTMTLLTHLYTSRAHTFHTVAAVVAIVAVAAADATVIAF